MTKPRKWGNRVGLVVDDVIAAEKLNMDAYIDTALHIVSKQDKQAMTVLAGAAKRSRQIYQALVYLRAGEFDEAEKTFSEKINKTEE